MSYPQPCQSLLCIAVSDALSCIRRCRERSRACKRLHVPAATRGQPTGAQWLPPPRATPASERGALSPHLLFGTSRCRQHSGRRISTYMVGRKAWNLAARSGSNFKQPAPKQNLEPIQQLTFSFSGNCPAADACGRAPRAERLGIGRLPRTSARRARGPDRPRGDPRMSAHPAAGGEAGPSGRRRPLARGPASRARRRPEPRARPPLSSFRCEEWAAIGARTRSSNSDAPRRALPTPFCRR